MPKVATEISVRRASRDGWFVYTSEAIPGLYIASKDDRAAYNDVPKAIAQLFKLDWNANVSVSHKVGYDDFFSLVTLKSRAKECQIR